MDPMNTTMMALDEEPEARSRRRPPPKLIPAAAPEDDDREEEPSRATATGEGAIDWSDGTDVEDEEVEINFPVIEGGVVIYLGNSRRKSLSLKGKLFVERWEVPLDPARPGAPPVFEVAKSASDEGGNTVYDFATHNSRRQLIVSRLVPGTADPRLRGRPWTFCEHPEHLRRFHRSRDRNGDREFIVRVPPSRLEQFKGFMAAQERVLGRQQALQEYTTKR